MVISHDNWATFGSIIIHSQNGIIVAGEKIVKVFAENFLTLSTYFSLSNDILHSALFMTD
jgi:hypothetical protein